MAKNVVFSPNAPAPIGPYSQAIQAGNLLFVSGQIAIQQSTGKLLTASIEEEAHQVMKNLGEVLGAAQFNYGHIVKTTIFLKNMNDFPAVNAVYGSYFAGDPPARETVEVARLPKDVHVEISCIAVK
ncbi:MAG: RidA family protein [Cyclobacteriaceae bacterium]|nr:RidA family protein [Cyclobacteriaceae bacterium]